MKNDNDLFLLSRGEIQTKLSAIASELAGSYYYANADPSAIEYWLDYLKESNLHFLYYGCSHHGVGTAMILVLQDKNFNWKMFKGDHCSCGGFYLNSEKDLENISLAYLCSDKFDPYRIVEIDYKFRDGTNQELKRMRNYFLSLNN